MCREWKLRENIVDNDSDDTLSFTLKQQFIFKPELSNGLTGDEEVFFPNLIMFGTMLTVMREREAFVPTVIKV
jgi:scavenger receptor class B, member 1